MDFATGKKKSVKQFAREIWKKYESRGKLIFNKITDNNDQNYIANKRNCGKLVHTFKMMKNKITYGKNVYNKKEIFAVNKVLRNSTQMGKSVQILKKRFSIIFRKIWFNG